MMGKRGERGGEEVLYSSRSNPFIFRSTWFGKAVLAHMQAVLNFTRRGTWITEKFGNGSAF